MSNVANSVLPAVAIMGLSLTGCSETTESTIHSNDWYQSGREAVIAAQSVQPIDRKAKNVIFFIGDGMGVSTQTAARILEGQQLGVNGEAHQLSFERFPYTALSKTYTTSHQVADSAGTATAYHSGVKTRSGVIGVDETVPRGVCENMETGRVTSLLREAEAAGLSTGVVTTTRITHASPAAAYAHSPDRNWEGDAYMPQEAKDAGCVDIAQQLIDVPEGNGIDVAFGGGRALFMTAEQTDPAYDVVKGVRQDGRDLVADWQNNGGQYIWNSSQFAELDERPVLGLFAPSHMKYEADRAVDPAGEPSLTEMTALAIERLSQNEQGYFLFVEAGRIDHGHHGNSAHRALNDAVELSRAVARAVAMTNSEDTLIIVSADHSHGFTMVGYPERDNPILDWVRETDSQGNPSGELALANDGLPYTSVSYTTGYTVEREDGYEQNDPMSPDFRQGARVPSDSEHHGGEDVVIMAQGPQAHLFRGVVEQHYIYHVMAHALAL